MLIYMAFVVQAHIDDHTLSATTEPAKEAFAKAVEWQAGYKFIGVIISDGVRSFTITEFALAWRPWTLRTRSMPRPTTGGQGLRMMKPYPTYRQREVLQFLMQDDWVPILKLVPVGDKLLGNLLQTGWIERSPDLKTSHLYRITEAGRIAFRTPVPIR